MSDQPLPAAWPWQQNNMRSLDRFLQYWRIRVASRWISAGSRILDVGCYRGELFRFLGDRIGPSVGLDPLAPETSNPRYRLIAQAFCEPLPFPEASFDVVALLATLEHIEDKEPLARECRRLVRPNGRVIVTVPGRVVDGLLGVLVGLHLADGMSLEQHHGFEPQETVGLFLRHGFALEHRSRFQAGVNNLFVFCGKYN